MAGFAAFTLAPGIVVCAFTPSTFLRGLILGVVLAAVPGVIWSWTLQVTGTAPRMMGDQAEQWTAQELRKLRRQGWRVVNHFLLTRGDIDHVLVGPGGADAVETKWSADRDSDYARQQEREAVAQALSSSRSMTLWRDLRRTGVTVRPLVVLWGGGARLWDSGQRTRMIEGVPVIAGSALLDWTRALPTDVLDPAAVEHAWTVLEAQTSSRDGRDRVENPVPSSGAEYAGRFLSALVAAMLAFVLGGQVLDSTQSIPWTVCVSASTLGPALALSRVRFLRFAAWGWIAGGWLPTVALLLAWVLTELR